MAVDDPLDISNGTCYYAVNTEANKDYIPCGNVDVGLDWHCCVAGDICLEDSACYHKNYGITYLAGCTDQKYGAPSCPYKGKYGSQQWTGLQRCDDNPDLDDGDDIWAACKETGDVPGSKPPARCTCFSDTQVISDKPKLDNVALLPTSLGGPISWYDGKKPSIDPNPVTTTITVPKSVKTVTSSVTLTSSTSSITSSITSSSDSSSDSSSTPTPVDLGPGDASPVTPPTDAPNASTNTSTGPTLSTAAQAGIGVGAGVGALLIGCLIYLALLLRKRRKAKTHSSSLDSKSTARQDLPSTDNPPSSLAAAAPPFPTNGQTHPSFQSELAADEPKSAVTTTTTTTTPPAPYSPSAASIPFSPTAASFSSQQKQYTAYNPTLHGNYAEKREAGGQMPVSPMSPEPQASPAKEEEVPVVHIHELEG
ncbi:hypothetical protein F5Y00DRAFT_135654 [Daldinia vernicosa]|uniref:uncharacterized protein n=1 Tax=Daldinia vernicosa TaxID=114800 RepID=UPI002007B3DB|nr:uncharacterized protein F5Y00DRAFT_135654 [Daldinia vernicosa]KAI0853249.1 hypothetical protein F5Y00DRAFT_135654 [Daldinia vernicosa]